MKFKPEENSSLFGIRTFQSPLRYRCSCLPLVVLFHTEGFDSVTMVNLPCFNYANSTQAVSHCYFFGMLRLNVRPVWSSRHAKIQNKARPNPFEIPPKGSKDMAIRYVKGVGRIFGKLRTSQTG